ncbi:hypothetical protein ALP50_101004 [Pseudomonas syringae pv. spinaceae]|nr:hypothetical protein ALP50_101004 [Pseudomonas syringae pv. spinaceae]
MSIITPNGLGASMTALISTTSQKPSIKIFPSPQNSFIACPLVISVTNATFLHAFRRRTVDVLFSEYASGVLKKIKHRSLPRLCDAITGD